MLKVMADENEYIQGLSIAVTDETIRVTRQFLKDHPEEIKNPNPKPYNSPKIIMTNHDEKGYMWSPLAFIISEFLGWSEQRIYESLQRIEMESCS